MAVPNFMVIHPKVEFKTTNVNLMVALESKSGINQSNW